MISVNYSPHLTSPSHLYFLQYDINEIKSVYHDYFLLRLALLSLVIQNNSTGLHTKSFIPMSAICYNGPLLMIVYGNRILFVQKNDNAGNLVPTFRLIYNCFLNYFKYER